MPKVLLIEDDQVISSSIRELLEENDFLVTIADNGRSGFELLAKIDRPNVILLDLMMPVMDGFKFREIQLADARYKDIPVIIMSADGHVEEKRVRTAATDYLKKPVDVYTLIETLIRVAGA